MRKFKNIAKKKKSTSHSTHVAGRKKLKVVKEQIVSSPEISVEPQAQPPVSPDSNNTISELPQNTTFSDSDKIEQVTQSIPQPIAQHEVPLQVGPTEKITNELMAQLKKTEATIPESKPEEKSPDLSPNPNAIITNYLNQATPLPGLPALESEGNGQTSGSAQNIIVPDSTPPISTDVAPDSRSGNKMKIIITLILLIVIAGAGAFGFLFLQNSRRQLTSKQLTITISPTITNSKSIATPTPLPLDLSKYSVKVLNGSGISGQASVGSGILSKEGFTVSSVGNADAYDYIATVIQAKSTVPAQFTDKLKTVLGKTYVLAPVATLSATQSPDVVVIIGSKKNN